MALKKVRQFIKFDWEGFAQEKRIMATGCKPWKEYGTDNILGTIIESVIVQDDTQYEQKEGEQVSNLFETLKFKVPKNITVPPRSYIKPVNVKVTVYGKYMNELSIKCDAVQVIPTQKG